MTNDAVYILNRAQMHLAISTVMSDYDYRSRCLAYDILHKLERMLKGMD